MSVFVLVAVWFIGGMPGKYGVGLFPSEDACKAGLEDNKAVSVEEGFTSSWGECREVAAPPETAKPARPIFPAKPTRGGNA